MTDNGDLPSELQQLERDLIEHSRRRTSDDLRPRILGDLRSRLRAEQLRSRWQFALAVALVVLVWMNLSISATQATDFGLRPATPPENVETIAEQIRQLAPELSPEESRREAILMQCSSTLVCYPRLQDYARQVAEKETETAR
jgi:hypothetical protein